MLSFILFHLAKNPNVQKTLYEEINQRCKNNQMDESTFANMPYLKACIKESLRFVTDRFFNLFWFFWGEVNVLLLHAPLENILVIWGDDHSGQGLESLGAYNLRANFVVVHVHLQMDGAAVFAVSFED